jgi:hypothetical protein
MTVEELVVELQKFPQHLRVLIASDAEGNQIFKLDKDCIGQSLAEASDEKEYEFYIWNEEDVDGEGIDPDSLERVIVIWP